MGTVTRIEKYVPATQAELDKAARQMSAARTLLMIRSTFTSVLALNMRLIGDETVPTACTDGRAVRYNPKWVLTLSRDEQIFLIGHEVWHPAFQHVMSSRRGTRDPILWNVAGDFVINNMLKKAGFTMIQGVCVDPKYDGWTTEAVYDDLMKNAKQGGGKGQGPGGIGCDLDDPSRDPGESGADADQRLGNEIRQRIAQAAQQSRQTKEYGNLPGDIKRLIDELLNPKVDWRTLLRRFMSERAKDDYSWKVRNKRHDVILPGLWSENIGHIVCVIDTSGSIDDKQFKAFMSEVQAIREEVHPIKTSICCCDTRVENPQEFDSDESILTYQAAGGGGTSFKPPFNWVAEMPEPPVCLLYFTDGYGDFPDEPDYPVLWAMTTDVVAPFGETVRIDE